jgi:L-lactate dehydrogenase complex protein LldF
LNACPVYRKVGGHAYGWVYPGPIGAIVSPVLSGLKEGKALPFASSLCGACREVCPVRIDIPSMLLHLRGELAEGVVDPSQKSRGLVDSAAFKAWRFGMSGRVRFDLGARMARWVLWPLARAGWVVWLPPPLGGWTRSRQFRLPAKKSFTAQWNAGRPKYGKSDTEYRRQSNRGSR